MDTKLLDFLYETSSKVQGIEQILLLLSESENIVCSEAMYTLGNNLAAIRQDLEAYRNSIK